MVGHFSMLFDRRRKLDDDMRHALSAERGEFGLLPPGRRSRHLALHDPVSQERILRVIDCVRSAAHAKQRLLPQREVAGQIVPIGYQVPSYMICRPPFWIVRKFRETTAHLPGDLPSEKSLGPQILQKIRQIIIRPVTPFTQKQRRHPRRGLDMEPSCHQGTDMSDDRRVPVRIDHGHRQPVTSAEGVSRQDVSRSPAAPDCHDAMPQFPQLPRHGSLRQPGRILDLPGRGRPVFKKFRQRQCHSLTFDSDLN